MCSHHCYHEPWTERFPNPQYLGRFYSNTLTALPHATGPPPPNLPPPSSCLPPFNPPQVSQAAGSVIWEEGEPGYSSLFCYPPINRFPLQQ